jgi:hypothetical protein
LVFDILDLIVALREVGPVTLCLGFDGRQSLLDSLEHFILELQLASEILKLFVGVIQCLSPSIKKLLDRIDDLIGASVLGDLALEVWFLSSALPERLSTSRCTTLTYR